MKLKLLHNKKAEITTTMLLSFFIMAMAAIVVIYFVGQSEDIGTEGINKGLIYSCTYSYDNEGTYSIQETNTGCPCDLDEMPDGTKDTFLDGYDDEGRYVGRYWTVKKAVYSGNNAFADSTFKKDFLDEFDKSISDRIFNREEKVFRISERDVALMKQIVEGKITSLKDDKTYSRELKNYLESGTTIKCKKAAGASGECGSASNFQDVWFEGLNPDCKTPTNECLRTYTTKCKEQLSS